MCINQMWIWQEIASIALPTIHILFSFTWRAIFRTIGANQCPITISIMAGLIDVERTEVTHRVIVWDAFIVEALFTIRANFPSARHGGAMRSGEFTDALALIAVIRVDANGVVLTRITPRTWSESEVLAFAEEMWSRGDSANEFDGVSHHLENS